MLEAVHTAWRDFLTETTLCRRAGCAPDKLVMAAAKELIDNALDVSPHGISVSIDPVAREILVRDHGPGLSESKIFELFSVARESISSKRWRQARRGALGNGLRVVMGVATISGGSVTVESRGIALILEIAPNGTARARQRPSSPIAEGTRVRLIIGPDLHPDWDEIETYADEAQAGAGIAFGGTKAVPQWFDEITLIEILKDVRPETSVLEFARQFDLTPAAYEAIKARAARISAHDLLDAPELCAGIAAAILSGGREPPRVLKRMGRQACEGAYAFAELTWRLGGVEAMPAIVEVWTRGEPVKDRKTHGNVWIDRVFVNRTPALLLRETYGSVDPDGSLRLYLEGYRLDVPAGILKGPCSLDLDLAVTTPELPLISEGKAVDFRPFMQAIVNTIAATLKRAYCAPVQTLAESKAQARLFKPARPPKPEKPPKPEEPPREKGPLAKRLCDLGEQSGRAASSLLVMSGANDPYALDKPRNHHLARWYRDALEAAGLLAAGTIYLRGSFYALIGDEGPDGTIFVNTVENWRLINRAAKAARWLGYIPFEKIRDERNAQPVERDPGENNFTLSPSLLPLCPKMGVPQKPTLTIDVPEDQGFPRERQPFRLVLFGEKTSLEPVLSPIAERFGAALYLPSGEISDTFIAQMARLGAADGRRSVIFTFCDFDPTGNNMPVNIARKLEALKQLSYPGFEFDLMPVALTAEQVRELGLPSTPMKAAERRADQWRVRHGGLEQTEIDALASLHPDILAGIAEDAIGPFFDFTLAARQREVEERWQAEAEERLQETDKETLEDIEAELAEIAEEIRPLTDAFNETTEKWREEADNIEIDFPPFEPPKATFPDTLPNPLVSSDMDPVQFIDALKEQRVAVGKGEAGDE